MVTVTVDFVDSIALNESAAKNGRDLVKKKSFTRLDKSEDGSLLFGECKGSGKEPYRCSADFVKPESPVYRCTCPSRQFPCKHVLGLLYAYANGRTFEAADIPADIAEKREKAEKRDEKRQTDAGQTDAGEKPKRKVNKSALVKKIAAQLEGIDQLEKLLLQIVQAGIASVDARLIRLLDEQVKQLDTYYVTGLQTAMRELLERLRPTEQREQAYTGLMDRLTVLYALVKRSRDYLNARAADPDMPMDTGTVLEERIGHAWQLAELRELGRTANEVELVQLAFHSYADHARAEYVDEGFWISLSEGNVYSTVTYRPYRAAKYIKEEDSFFPVLRIKELFVYPAELNQRVRWEEAASREAMPGDLRRIIAHAGTSIADSVKQVKNQLKNPLADKHPCLLLRASRIDGSTEGGYVLEDAQGARLALENIGAVGQPTVQLLEMLQPAQLADSAVLVVFEHDLASGKLSAQPLTIVTDSEIIRLLY